LTSSLYSCGQMLIPEVIRSYEEMLTPLAFIKEKYPWFLPVFDAYPYNIQRADVIRYFALAYYGGTYLDLDLVFCGSFAILTRDYRDVIED
jgi:mannosyltransferase OCH1-like enzyme